MICSETQRNGSIVTQNQEVLCQKSQSQLLKSRSGSHQALNCREVTRSRIPQRQFDTILESKINSFKNPETKCQSCQAWEEWALDSERSILLIEKKMIEREKILHQKMKSLKSSLQSERKQFILKQQQYEQQKLRDEQLNQKLNALVRQLKNQIQSSVVDQKLTSYFQNQSKGFIEQRQVNQNLHKQNATVKNYEKNDKNNEIQIFVDKEVNSGILKNEQRLHQSSHFDVEIQPRIKNKIILPEKLTQIQQKITKSAEVQFECKQEIETMKSLEHENVDNSQNINDHENINSIPTHQSQYFQDPSLSMSKFKKAGKMQTNEVKNDLKTKQPKQSCTNIAINQQKQKDILSNKSEVQSKLIPSSYEFNQNYCKQNSQNLDQNLESSLVSLSSESSFEEDKQKIKVRLNYQSNLSQNKDNRNQNDLKRQIYGIWQQFDQEIVHKQNQQETSYSNKQPHQYSSNTIVSDSKFRKPLPSQMKKSFVEGQVQKQPITKFSGPKKLSAGNKTLSHNNLFSIKNGSQTQKQIEQSRIDSFFVLSQNQHRIQNNGKESSIKIQPSQATNARKNSECSEASGQTLKDKRFSFSKNAVVNIGQNSGSIFGQSRQFEGSLDLFQPRQINNCPRADNSLTVTSPIGLNSCSSNKKIVSKQALEQACSEIVLGPSAVSTLKTIKLSNNVKHSAEKSRQLNHSHTDCSNMQIEPDKYSQHGSYSTNYHMNRNLDSRGLAADELKTVMSHCYTNYEQKPKAQSSYNMKHSNLRSQVIEQECENQGSTKNGDHILEQINKLQFENQNLKSYNRVLLQKLSNSRPRKY